MSASCLRSDQLDRFLGGQASAAEQESWGWHIASCEACQERLEARVALPNVNRSVATNGVGWNGQLAQEFANRLLDETRLAEISEDPIPQIPGCDVRRLLGQGGMGKVYLAWQESLQRLVAVKVLPPHTMGKASAQRRFAREIAAAGRVNHPGIVTAYSAAQSDGLFYLLLEYVEGENLSCIMRRKRPLSVADACEIGRQAALALQAAHEKGLVHRDIKPSNLMLTPDGTVKVLDLGLARIHLDENASQKLTHSGQILGTIDYMAPEQGDRAGSVDIRSDIFSLGATLFKLLSGRAPLDCEGNSTPVEKLTALALAKLPSLSEVRKGLPKTLVNVIDRSLSHDANQRYSTPGEMARALEPFCTGHSIETLHATATETEPDTVAMHQDATTHVHSQTHGRGSEQSRPHPKATSPFRLLWIPLAALVVVASVSLAVYLESRRSSNDVLDVEPDTDVVVDRINETPRSADPAEDGPTTVVAGLPSVPRGDVDVEFAQRFLGEGRHLTVIAGDKTFGGVGSLQHHMPKEPFKIVDVYFMGAAPNATDVDVKALADARLGRLQSVTFHRQPLLTANSLASLVEAYPNLKRLNIGGLTCWGSNGTSTGLSAEDVLPILMDFRQLEGLRIHVAPGNPDAEAWAAGIAAMPSLKRVELEGSVTTSMLRQLTRLPRLEKLVLASVFVEDDNLQPLGEMSHLRELTLLRTGKLTSGVFEHLESASQLALVTFDLKSSNQGLPSDISHQKLEALANNMPFCRFAYVNDGNLVTIGGRGEREFAASFLGDGHRIAVVTDDGQRRGAAADSQLPPQPFKIRGVVLSGQVTDKHLDLIRNARFHHLEFLTIQNYQRSIEPSRLMLLAKAIPGLRDLHLRGVLGHEASRQHTQALVAALREFRSLESISIDQPSSSHDVWLEGIAESKSLRRVDLRKFRANLSADLPRLASLRTMEELSLSLSVLTDDDARQLAKLTSLRKLVFVEVRGLTPVGWRQLKHLPKLESIDLFDESISKDHRLPGTLTPDDVRSFASELPDCEIRFYEGGKLLTLNATKSQ